MAEAAEPCHWEMVQKMSGVLGAEKVPLADWAAELQREHVETVRRASLEFAEHEARS